MAARVDKNARVVKTRRQAPRLLGRVDVVRRAEDVQRVSAAAALELGLMALGLALCFAVERHLRAPASRWNPLRVYGETALFFYMLHFIGLGAAAMALTGGIAQRGLPETYLAAGATLVALYPVCLLWRRYKRAHPDGWPQYI